MSLQIINESFINFIEEKQINIPEDFIDMFIESITMDQWIDSETAKKYLEYQRQDNFNQSLKKFILNEDYKEISKQEYEKIRSLSIRGEIDQQNNKKQHGGQNKKYFLITRETFKTMLLMRDSENGKKFRRYMITLEKIFFEFMIEFFGSKENLIKQLEQSKKQLKRKLIKKQQELMDKVQEFQEEIQEKDQIITEHRIEIDQLQDTIDQQINKYNVIKIYKINENDQQYEIDHPQIICFTSNINDTMKRYSRLLNKHYKQTFIYSYQIVENNLDRSQAIQLREQLVYDYTGIQKIQHQSKQSIIPLFESD